MAIVINGSGTVTGVTNVGSAAANTAVVLQDSGSNTNTCRAWVNFNGTGTVAIRASFNVSSITDNGTGDYTVNFTNAMPDANYSYNVSNSVGAGFCFPTLNQNSSLGAVAPTTTACRFVLVRYNGATYDDTAYVNVSVFR